MQISSNTGKVETHLPHVDPLRFWAIAKADFLLSECTDCDSAVVGFYALADVATDDGADLFGYLLNDIIEWFIAPESGDFITLKLAI